MQDRHGSATRPNADTLLITVDLRRALSRAMEKV